MNLVSERDKWKQEFEMGYNSKVVFLSTYKKERNNETWRTSRPLEHLCEYVMYLEKQLEILNERK